MQNWYCLSSDTFIWTEKIEMFLLVSYGGEKNQTNQKLAWFRALFNHLKLCCNDSTFISVDVVLAHTYTESLITS